MRRPWMAAVELVRREDRSLAPGAGNMQSIVADGRQEFCLLARPTALTWPASCCHRIVQLQSRPQPLRLVSPPCSLAAVRLRFLTNVPAATDVKRWRSSMTVLPPGRQSVGMELAP